MPHQPSFPPTDPYTLRLEELAAWQRIQLDDLHNTCLALRHELESLKHEETFRRGIENAFRKPQ